MRLLLRTSRIVNSERLPMAGGRLPTKLFLDRINLLSFARDPKEGGIVPWSKFNDNSILTRFVALASCGGIVPCNWLSVSTMDVSLVKSPMEEGIVPVSEELRRLTDTTELPSHTTPAQLSPESQGPGLLTLQFQNGETAGCNATIMSHNTSLSKALSSAFRKKTYRHNIQI